MRRKFNFIDLTGQRFARLVAVSYSDWYWNCVCDCGNYVRVQSTSLRRGLTKSCGCWKRDYAKANYTTHGMSGTRIYSVWLGMRKRCEDPSEPSFPNYGGRGIKVCERWSRFEMFLKDMGIPAKGLTLERVNNDDGYSPENCVWATRLQQARNKRGVRKVKIGDRFVAATEAAEILGVNYRTLLGRLDRRAAIQHARGAQA